MLSLFFFFFFFNAKLLVFMDFNLCFFLNQHFPISFFTKTNFNHKLRETSASPNIFPKCSVLISYHYMFEEPTKIDCAEERILVWEGS